MKVKDLIAKLLTLDSEQELITTGVDYGGYDAMYTPDFVFEKLTEPAHPEWAVNEYANYLYVGGIHDIL